MIEECRKCENRDCKNCEKQKFYLMGMQTGLRTALDTVNFMILDMQLSGIMETGPEYRYSFPKMEKWDVAHSYKVLKELIESKLEES